MALTANSLKIHKGNTIVSMPVAGSTTIYRMGLVCANASGLAVPADDAANYKFMGVAEEAADNSAGASGDIRVRLMRDVVLPLKITGATQADIGKVVYCTDDETCQIAAPTNAVKVGEIVEVVSATEVLVDTSRL